MKLEFTKYDFINVGPHAALNSKWTPERAAKIYTRIRKFFRGF